MTRGTRKLHPDAIERLKWYRRARRLSIQQMKLAMNPAPFTWQVLKNAIDGKAIRVSNYEFIVWWLEGHLPARPGPPMDGKSRAAGNGRDLEEREEKVVDEETVPAARLRSES